MYFIAKGLINYFIIINNGRIEENLSMATEEDIPLIEDKKTYFEKIEENYKKIKEKIVTKAGIIHDFEDSRSAQLL